MNWYKQAESKNTDGIIYDIYKSIEDSVGGNWTVKPITDSKNSKVYWLQRILTFALHGKDVIKQGDSFSVYVRMWIKRASGKVVHPYDGSYEGASKWEEGQLSKPMGDLNEQAEEVHKRWDALYNMKPDDASIYDSGYGNRLFDIQIKLLGNQPSITGEEPNHELISRTSELDTPTEIAEHIKTEINRFYFGGDDGDERVEPIDPTGGGYMEPEITYDQTDAPVLAPNLASSKNWYKKAQNYQDIEDDPETYSDPDAPGMLNAYKYFAIGQDEESVDESYCWIYDGRKMHIKKGGTHYTNFPELHFRTKDDRNSYRGWYDPIQKMISVIIPRGVGEVDPALGASSLPTKLRVSLSDNFGTDNNIKVF